jgi:predicted unusual protein kinase regulating ubiquinone biosynthesis (AarF/ABC1/UbiB family)
MKVQYPGVDEAIEGDLRALKSILSMAKLIPKGHSYDSLFKEIRTMLHQEVDYARELETTREFRNRLADDPRYVIPEVFPEFSSKRILTTSFEKGIPLDSAEVLNLSQERRNALGVAALQLYFREIFEIGQVQTDPHFGNYRVRVGSGGESDQLILFDFGAVRKLSKTFLHSYLKIIRGAHTRNPKLMIEGATGLGFLKEEDPEELQNVFIEFCYLLNEPFYSPDIPGVLPTYFDSNGQYRFGDSDLPARVAKKGAQFIATFRLRPPPRELVFLDRKLGGTFILLSALKVKIRGSESVQRYIQLTT